jgi:hypothetical protein
LVVANQKSNNLTLFMGNGDGTFTPANASPNTGTVPSAIAVGDFNGDGNLDLAVTNAADNTVSILLNQNCPSFPPALCTFAPAQLSPAVGSGPSSISAADMNADGFLDLVVANGSSSSVTILLGDGTGGFHAVLPQGQFDFSTGTAPGAVALLDFNQDGRLDIATSNAFGTLSFLRQAAVPQLFLASTNSSPVYGLFLEFSVNLTPPFGQPTPTGTLTFFDGSTNIGSVPLNSYQNYFDYFNLNAGSHQITAVYSGDSNFTSATSNAVSETVSPAQSTITLSSNVNTVSYVQPFTLTATILPQLSGNATGTVSFFDTASSASLGTTPLSNNSAQITHSKLSVGAHPIIAIYLGDSNFYPSNSPSYTENIIQASTTVSITSSPSTIALGQSATFTATVQPGDGNTATGGVAFFDGPNFIDFGNLSSNSAQFSTSALSVGPHTITAQYAGDSNFLASTSSTLLQTVNSAATSTTLTSSANPSAAGKSVTFTASVSSPITGTLSGTVNFYLDGVSTPFSSVALSSGTAHFSTSSLTAGFHTLTSVFVSSNSNFAGSTSAPLTQAVTDFTIAASPASNTISRGSSGTYTIRLTPEGGLTGNASLTCSGLPGGTTCAFSPSTVAFDGANPSRATVTITAAHNAATGTHTLNFKGTSGGVTHTTTVTLQIN